MSRKSILPAICLTLVLTGAGCISFSTGGSTGGQGDGGVFKTANKGDLWAQKVAIPTTDGSRRSINSVNVTVMVQDPGDPRAIYLGTAENGLWYTFDGGDSWRAVSGLNRGFVPSVAVDYKDKCTLFVAYDNKLMKSTDCARTWSDKYVDTRPTNGASAVAVDFYNPNIVWLAYASGDLLRTDNGGDTWKLVKNFDNNHILRLVISAADSRRIFVVLKDKGIWRSDDAGATWKDLSPGYSKFAGAEKFRDIAIGVSDPKLMLMASDYGVLRSKDNGDVWESIDLLTPPKTALIYSVAIDPKDPNNVYYGTATTFYRTSNGGTNWVPKKLPTSRAATNLLVDSSDSNVLYMGTTKFNQ